MTNSTKNVLVFGPTGGVGRATALAAGKSDAKVWLAMRDTSKALPPGLGQDSEKYPRVQADLSKPESLTSAVQQSGATAAFVYTIQESDHMKASFEALKAAGVSYIVLLSSWGVKGHASEAVNYELFIPRIHAQTEVALEETGVNFTALRPAWFNTNLLLYKAGILKGEVEILRPDFKVDFIAPEDIGTVAGALLVEGKATKPILLNGPKLRPQREGFEILQGALGKTIKVKEIKDEEVYEKLKFLPIPVLETMVKNFEKGGFDYLEPAYTEAVANIKKYGKIEPTQLEDWVASHKSLFMV